MQRVLTTQHLHRLHNCGKMREWRRKVDHKVIHKLSMSIARKYKRRCWWADLEDLYQEAYRTMLKCKDTWDPQGRVPFEGYAWRAAALELRRYLWRNTAPVNETIHNYKLLEGVHRAELKDNIPSSDSLEDKMIKAEWKYQVRRRLLELLDDPTTAPILEVLFENKRAKDLGDVKEIYKLTGKLRRQAAKDLQLYNLWREM